MSMEKAAGQLFKYASSTAIVCGVIAILVASAGSITVSGNLFALDPAWRLPVWLFGLALCAAGVLSAAVEPGRFHLPSLTRSKNSYGIQISYPGYGEVLASGVYVARGTFKRRPPSNSLWLFLRSGHAYWWPQSVVHVTESGWQGRFFVSGTPGTECTLMLAAVGSEGVILCEYYVQVGHSGSWHPLRGLTSDIVECTEVRFIRGAE